MQYFESVLTKSKIKTFQQYEAQILIKQVLIAANHFSYADLTLVGTIFLISLNDIQAYML